MTHTVLVIGQIDVLGQSAAPAFARALAAAGLDTAQVVTSIEASSNPVAPGDMEVPAAVISWQIEEALARGLPQMVCLGKLCSEEQVELVAKHLAGCLKEVPLFCAPSFIDEEAQRNVSLRCIAHWKRRLAHEVDYLVVGPEDAELLAGSEVGDTEALVPTAAVLTTLGCDTVLLDGRFPGEPMRIQVLADEEGLHVNEAAVIAESRQDYSTATLAANFANGLLSGLDAVAAFERVQETLVDQAALNRDHSCDSKVRRLIG